MKAGPKLDNLLNERGVSQNELARRCGFTQSMVNNWVNGRNRLYADQAFLICKILEAPVAWLLDEDNEEPVPLAPSPWEVRVAEVVRAIGPERAWRRLVGSVDRNEATVDSGGLIDQAGKRGA